MLSFGPNLSFAKRIGITNYIVNNSKSFYYFRYREESCAYTEEFSSILYIRIADLKDTGLFANKVCVPKGFQNLKIITQKYFFVSNTEFNIRLPFITYTIGIGSELASLSWS